MIAKKISNLLLIPALFMIATAVFSQSARVGTTAANFLEIGMGSAASAIGEAAVSTTNDIASIYWNPAGLGYMERTEAQFTIQPWIVGINTSFVGVGLVIPTVGTLALSMAQVDYGETEVTTMNMQDGTGETYSAADRAITISFGRKLAQWFAFGASAKYVSSKIWHENASAFAVDMGVKLDTQFFSPSGDRQDGLSIGMSISNYGTKMRYDGMDLLHPIDISPEEAGNYRDTKGQFSLESWELPLIFRVGIALHPIVTGNHRITVAMDALHPNNNTESINTGIEYQLTFPRYGDFFLRGGYKALFMQDSEYGPTFGGGYHMRLPGNTGLKLDYCFKNMGLLGNTHSYTVGILF